MSEAIARYPVPSLEALTEDIRARIAEVQEKATAQTTSDGFELGFV